METPTAHSISASEICRHWKGEGRWFQTYSSKCNPRTVSGFFFKMQGKLWSNTFSILFPFSGGALETQWHVETAAAGYHGGHVYRLRNCDFSILQACEVKCCKRCQHSQKKFVSQWNQPIKQWVTRQPQLTYVEDASLWIDLWHSGPATIRQYSPLLWEHNEVLREVRQSSP